MWAAACAEAPVEIFKPGVVFETPRGPNARGYLDRKGLIHAHSVYSHDACDDMPVKDGVRDATCFDDFRRGLCQTKHDFVMLTDHAESFRDTEFPEILLYRAERGDQLIERGGSSVASWAACPGQGPVLVMAGMESGVMPVGVERHLLPLEERAYYTQSSSRARALHHQAGAVVLAQHTENWSPEELASEGFDGFEMYNLHANMRGGAGQLVALAVYISDQRPGLPMPDLVVLPLWNEDPIYLETWGSVLARGVKRVTTMATDCHQNTFRAVLEDGERVDSYRRMMGWLANHLLVRPGPDGRFDDQSIKEALKAGRLYGVLEAAGYAEGFDFYAEGPAGVAEMGGVAPVGARLIVKRPSVKGLDPKKRPPLLTVRLLRAREGGFEEVASSTDGDLHFEPSTPGAYRAEVVMVPWHLSEELRDFWPAVYEKKLVWVYSNPIYVE